MEPPTAQERSQRAEQQRTRRLSSRTCGYCGEPAQAMVPWGRRPVAICGQCQIKLETPAASAPFCAFDEVHPRDLRPQTSLEAIVVEARLLPAPDSVVEEKRPSLIGRILRAAAKIGRRGDGRNGTRAITGQAD